MDSKLSKKQKKALDFKKKKKGGVDPVQDKAQSSKRKRDVTVDDAEVNSDEEQIVEAAPEEAPQKKKQKKVKADVKRMIVFVGNLPYDCKEKDVMEHFKVAEPQHVRMRKGFAFVEFEGPDSSKRLNVALRLHHSKLSNRKINVELTAGGGGNTASRKAKIKEKNTRLQQQHTERMKKEQEAKKLQPTQHSQEQNPTVAHSKGADKEHTGIHPSRLRQMTKK